jgi:high-affinity iron transporter
MGATFVVTLREGFEAALLLGIVYAYLAQTDLRRHHGWVTTGAVLGLAASILLGVVVSFISGPLLDVGPDLVAAAVMLLAVVLLTWHAWWMQQHARAISGQVHRQIDEARNTGRLSVLAMIAFTAVFREGAETVLFLWGLMSQMSIGGAGGLVGATGGVAVAAVLGWLVFRGGRRIPLRRFFAVTTILLVLVAAGLFASALARLDGLGYLPSTPTLWDTSWFLEDGSGVGGFLAGLLGYRARPTLLEGLGWLVYVVGVATLLWRPTRRQPSPTRRVSTAQLTPR